MALRRRVYVALLAAVMALYFVLYVERRWRGPHDPVLDVVVVAAIVGLVLGLFALRPRLRPFAFGAIAVLSFVALAWLSDPGGPGLLVPVRRTESVPIIYALLWLAPLGWILLGASVVRLPWAVTSYVLPGIIVALIESRLFVEDLPWSVVYIALWPWFSLGVAQFFGFELGR